MKAWVRTDTDYVVLVFAETRGKAKVAAQYFDLWPAFKDVRLRRVPELDDVLDEEGIIDHEFGPTWCRECDPDWAEHEHWHYRGHPGDHCFSRCVL